MAGLEGCLDSQYDNVRPAADMVNDHRRLLWSNDQRFLQPQTDCLEAPVNSYYHPHEYETIGKKRNILANINYDKDSAGDCGKHVNDLSKIHRELEQKADTTPPQPQPPPPLPHSNDSAHHSNRRSTAFGYDVIRRVPPQPVSVGAEMRSSTDGQTTSMMTKTTTSEDNSPLRPRCTNHRRPPVVVETTGSSSLTSSTSTLSLEKKRKRFFFLNFGRRKVSSKVKAKTNIIDLNKNRILSPPTINTVKKKNKRQSLINLGPWRRPPTGILSFGMPRGGAAACDIDHHPSERREEKKVDIEMIRKLEEEIYKCREMKEQKRREARLSRMAEVAKATDGDVIFLNDNSAFGKSSHPILHIDSWKFAPMLMKRDREEGDDHAGDSSQRAAPQFITIPSSESVSSGGGGCKSIFVVDNSEYYPVLMKYEIRMKGDAPSSNIRGATSAAPSCRSDGADGHVSASKSASSTPWDGKESVASDGSRMSTRTDITCGDTIVTEEEPQIRGSRFRRFLQQRRSLNLSLLNNKRRSAAAPTAMTATTEPRMSQDDSAVMVTRLNNNVNRLNTAVAGIDKGTPPGEFERLRRRLRSDQIITNGQLCRSILDCDSLRMIVNKFNEIEPPSNSAARGPLNNKSKCLWLLGKSVTSSSDTNSNVHGKMSFNGRGIKARKCFEVDKAAPPVPPRNRSAGEHNAGQWRWERKVNLIRSSISADDLSCASSRPQQHFPASVGRRLNWSASDVRDLNALITSITAEMAERVNLRSVSETRAGPVGASRKISSTSSVHRPPPHGPGGSSGSSSSTSTNNNNSNSFSVRLRSSFRHKRHSVGASNMGNSSGGSSGTTDVVNTWVYRRRCFCYSI